MSDRVQLLKHIVQNWRTVVDFIELLEKELQNFLTPSSRDDLLQRGTSARIFSGHILNSNPHPPTNYAPMDSLNPFHSLPSSIREPTFFVSLPTWSKPRLLIPTEKWMDGWTDRYVHTQTQSAHPGEAKLIAKANLCHFLKISTKFLSPTVKSLASIHCSPPG